MPADLQAFFLPADGGRIGQRFCLFHPAQGSQMRGSVLYVHPFAEEMNKSRRMAALQARALAQAGYDVLQLDLLGCGDSSGDFGDATWQDWVSDVVQGARWLFSQKRSNSCAPEHSAMWLWGLRAGCLVATQAARQLDVKCHFLFWQPPSTGKPLWQQFLRLKVAGQMLGGGEKGAMEAMRLQLKNGTPVEVAGYQIAPGLALGLEEAMLTPPVDLPEDARVIWLEMSAREDAEPSPVSTKTISVWQQSGFEVASAMATGPAFWQTAEIEDAPVLIARTTAAMCL